mgnify:FL=1
MRRNWAPYLFLSPWLILTAIFFVYPFCDSIRLAFYQTNGTKSHVFVGWENFVTVLSDPLFWKAVRNTLVFTIVSLSIQLPLSLLLALLLENSQSRVVTWVRTLLFSPHLMGGIFVGIMFTVMFLPQYGLVNIAFANLFNLSRETDWLSQPGLVMPALIITNLLMYIGFNMIYFLAALQNVDRSLVEAARLDGASRFQVFRHVKLPAIKPVIIFVVITSTIGSLNLFELPQALLRGGGPDDAGLTVVCYLYNNAFLNADLGTGAAVGWILAMLIFVVSMAQVRISGAGKE